jgi:hypothetical protein
MNEEQSVSLSCRLVGEFDEDARQYAPVEPEFVPVSELPAPGEFLLFPHTRPRFEFPPSDEVSRKAREFWRKVIRRFTEPVPGKKNRFRVKNVAPEQNGSVVIESQGPHATLNGVAGTLVYPVRTFSGEELEVSDKLCLVLFDTSELAGSEGTAERIRETVIPLPWSEIVNVRFEVTREVEAKGTSEQKAIH